MSPFIFLFSFTGLGGFPGTQIELLADKKREKIKRHSHFKILAVYLIMFYLFTRCWAKRTYTLQ